MTTLKEARFQKNLTQVELAEMVGVNSVQISQYESGRITPVPKTRRRIEAVLGPINWDGSSPTVNNWDWRVGVALLISLVGPDMAAKIITKTATDEEISRLIVNARTAVEPLLPAGVGNKTKED